MTDFSPALSPADLAIGGRLRAAREQAGQSLDEAAQRSSVPTSDLRCLEEARRRPLPAEVDRISAAYGVDLSDLLAPRQPVTFDAGTGRLALGSARRRVGEAVETEQVCAAYLALLFAARAEQRGQQIPLRSSDVEALVQVVGEDADRIEQRLIELMGCTREEASLLRGVILRHRALAASVGVAAAVAVAAVSGGLAADTTPATAGSGSAVTAEDARPASDRTPAVTSAAASLAAERGPAAAGALPIVGGSTAGSFFMMDELLGDETSDTEAAGEVQAGDPVDGEPEDGRASDPGSTAPVTPGTPVPPGTAVPPGAPGAPDGPEESPESAEDAPTVDVPGEVPPPAAAPAGPAPSDDTPADPAPSGAEPPASPVEPAPVDPPPAEPVPVEPPPAEPVPVEPPPAEPGPVPPPPAEPVPVEPPPAQPAPDEPPPAESVPVETTDPPADTKRTPPGHADSPGNNGIGAGPKKK